jgi:hypothetical protein
LVRRRRVGRGSALQKRMGRDFRSRRRDQGFDAGAFHLYAVYQHFDDPTLSLIDVTKTHVPLKLDGFDLGYVGGRMYF